VVDTSLTPRAGTRLPGCRAESLDSYLRSLGLLFVAEPLVPGLRASWDEDGVLVLHAAGGVDGVLDAVVAATAADARRTLGWGETPWRGAAGRGRAFAELRNEAPEELLDWFDACALPREARSRERVAGRTIGCWAPAAALATPGSR